MAVARARRSGRPPAAADRAAREALLDAAVALFAERGVPATASSRVAERAGVTPAMVHYYFKNRARLLDAVVAERLATFPAYVFAPPLPASPASAMVAAVVRRIFEAAAIMPWMPPIWIREVVAEGGSLRERMLKHFPIGAAMKLAEALARDQRAGRVPRGVEPRLAFLSIAGATLLPLAVRSLWVRLPGLAGITDDQLERHALAVLSAGLAPARQGAK
jgi:AcrR family transcriptional regulator